MARRPHGTGSVYYDAPRDRWVGSVELGWTAKGTRRRKRVTAPTERAVKAKMRDLLRTANASDVSVVGGKPTVRTWADQWLEITQGTARPTTWATNRSSVRKWVIPTIGHKRLENLSPGDVRAVAKAITDAGREPSTAHRAQAVLMRMLRQAVLDGVAIVPPGVFLTEQTELNETDRDSIPLDDALAILDAASTRPDRSRWVAALLQGMRPAECLGLTWAAVDLDAGTIDVSWQLKSLPYKIARDRSSGFRVPKGYTARQLDGALHLVRPKTQSGKRIIPLVPWMANTLREWQAIAPASRHGLVWPRKDGRPQTDSADRAAWVEVVDVARVARLDDDNQGRRYALYESRHTTATLLKEAGVDDETIVAILGHASILSTKAYLHTSSARTQAALNALAERLGLTAAP
jgi:integrase